MSIIDNNVEKQPNKFGYAAFKLQLFILYTFGMHCIFCHFLRYIHIIFPKYQKFKTKVVSFMYSNFLSPCSQARLRSSSPRRDLDRQGSPQQGRARSFSQDEAVQPFWQLLPLRKAWALCLRLRRQVPSQEVLFNFLLQIWVNWVYWLYSNLIFFEVW